MLVRLNSESSLTVMAFKYKTEIPSRREKTAGYLLKKMMGNHFC